MNKKLLAAPLMALFLGACESRVDTATCYVDITDPDNVTASVKSNFTNGVIAKAGEFIYSGRGDMKAENIEHNLPYTPSSMTLDFNDRKCGVLYLVNNHQYPMELIGGEFPEPTVAPE